MSTAQGNGVSPRAAGTPARDRAVGSSSLTVRIYQAVLDAGHPLTAQEIYDQVKGVPGFHTDTRLWAQRQDPSGRVGVVPDDLGLVRVKGRIDIMRAAGVLCSTGGRRPVYSAGRPPKGFAMIPPGPVDGHYGWYDIDVARNRERLSNHLALVALLENGRTELAKGKARVPAALLAEAVRLLEKVSFQ
jgi:hypothetical protein